MIALAGQAAGQYSPASKSAAIGSLKRDFPDIVTFDDPNGRLRCVLGSKMNTGESVEASALAWVDQYAQAFTGEKLALDIKQTFPLTSGKSVVHMRQTINGIPVEEVGLRVMVYNSDRRVAFVSGRFLEEPEGGMPAATLSAKQAEEAARKHPKAEGLDWWLEPELLITRSAEQQEVGAPAWKVTGYSGKRTIEPRTFYVHAHEGTVIREFVPIASCGARSHDHGAELDISGTVQANISPAPRPDMRAPQYVGNCKHPRDDFCICAGDTDCGILACPPTNPPVLMALAGARIEARQSGTSIVIASDTVQEDGSYLLAIEPSITLVDIQISLENAFSLCADSPWVGQFPVPDPPVPTVGHRIVIQRVPNGQAHNAIFNVLTGSSDEYDIARANGFRFAKDARDYYKTRLPIGELFPLVDEQLAVIVNHTGTQCAAFTWDFLTMILIGSGNQFSANCDDCPNLANSMPVVHEYGHMAQFRLLNWSFLLYPARHEGYADCLPMLLYESEIFAPDYHGCNGSLREPLCTNRQFPVCQSGGPGSFNSYNRSELLSAIWARIMLTHAGGAAATRDLFFEWSFLSVPPSLDQCGVADTEQSADPATLHEVLVADDDDGVLFNGTPNAGAICGAFAAHSIYESGETGACSESSGMRCYADFDASGTLDVHDLLMFQNSFANGSLVADCDVDGLLSCFDFLCVVTLFSQGCP